MRTGIHIRVQTRQSAKNTIVIAIVFASIRRGIHHIANYIAIIVTTVVLLIAKTEQSKMGSKMPIT